MKKQDKQFLTLLMISCVLLTSIIAENIIKSVRNAEAQSKKELPQAKIFVDQAPVEKKDLNINKIKDHLKKAKIVPKEAKYWEETE
jgi:hypothetical protein